MFYKVIHFSVEGMLLVVIPSLFKIAKQSSFDKPWSMGVQDRTSSLARTSQSWYLRGVKSKHLNIRHGIFILLTQRFLEITCAEVDSTLIDVSSLSDRSRSCICGSWGSWNLCNLSNLLHIAAIRFGSLPIMQCGNFIVGRFGRYGISSMIEDHIVPYAICMGIHKASFNRRFNGSVLLYLTSLCLGMVTGSPSRIDFTVRSTTWHRKLSEDVVCSRSLFNQLIL